MKKICIFGAGGFAKEVYWLAHQCGREVEAFIDKQEGGHLCGVPIKNDKYFDPTKHQAVVAVGKPALRQEIVIALVSQYGLGIFASLISPSANIMGDSVNIGLGAVICANCILTCDIKLGNWAQLNLATTIGHDTAVGDFFTTAPGVHVSGKVQAGHRVYMGTNASTVEDISICDDVTIGAAACVAKDLVESGTYVGVPAKKLEKKNG
jgi:sugar O-acyltransferase (sialic acid O-acetyltransferase NeuD family)